MHPRPAGIGDVYFLPFLDIRGKVKQAPGGSGHSGDKKKKWGSKTLGNKPRSGEMGRTHHFLLKKGPRGRGALETS